MELWLGEVEERMRASVRAQTRAALTAYVTAPRTQWVLQWPAMVVIAAAGVFWARGVEDAIEKQDVASALEQNTADLMGLTDLVRGIRWSAHVMPIVRFVPLSFPSHA